MSSGEREIISGGVPSAPASWMTVRGVLLVTGWAVFLLSLGLPGLRVPADAWSAEWRGPGLAALLSTMLELVAALEFHVGRERAMGAVVGGGAIAATLVFLLSPALVRSNPGRVLRLLRWLAPALLLIWFAPVRSALDVRHDWTLLYGYYVMAAGYTLVFLAVAWPPVGHTRPTGRRGFEPVLAQTQAPVR